MSKHKHSFSQEEVRGSDVFCVIRNKANTVSTMVLILLEVLYHINIFEDFTTGNCFAQFSRLVTMLKHKHSFSQKEARGSDVFRVIRNKGNTVATPVRVLPAKLQT